MRYLLETDERTGYLTIPLARVTEVTADRRIILDERWIPPTLVCSGAAPLSGAAVWARAGDAIKARAVAAMISLRMQKPPLFLFPARAP